ncbi:AAA-16 domain-containing protein [Phanerochaete sordida]|uniref:AAA-16 domain-containing protein n=1 Tax=Phanerochaete sordida TaxID=48140 RepID=A0A9P3G6U4_9APHY|nr:AAA-16 domain-containing protein [Phanerochaete sordida]
MTDTSLAIAGPVLDILKDGLALVPIPGLGLIPQALSKVLEGVQVVRQNSKSRKAFEDEAKRLGAVIQSISSNTTDSVSANGGSQDRSSGETAVRKVAHSPELQSGMNELLHAINDIGTRTTSLKGGKISSFIHALNNRDVLQEMKGDLTNAIEDFKIKAHAAVDKGVQDIRLRLILKELKCADAGYRSVHDQKSGLMDGTRQDLLSELVAWSKGQSPITERIYALTGQAGMGKSAVAYRLCTLLDNSSSPDLSSDTPTLGASFFFVRDGGNLSSLRSLFPTIARQLALSQPALLPGILQAITAFVDKGDNQLQSYAFESLLHKPLAHAALPSHGPIVIILDGLDECADDKLLCEALAQLIGLVNEVSWLRLFVASRPEVRILEALRSSEKAVHICQLSDDDVLEAGTADVGKYLTETILKIPQYNAYLEGNRVPLDTLVRRAGALFIFARISVNVLDSRAYRNNPEEGFRVILTSKAAGLTNLDSLYLQILLSEFPLADLAASPLIHINLISLLTVVCCAQLYLKIGQMAVFQNKLAQVSSIRSRTTAEPGITYALRKNNTVAMVARLSSVLLINSDGNIAPMHATFTEFLRDPQRCTDKHYHIDKGAGHAALASACLAAFTWQTTVEILSAVRNGEQDMRQYGRYSASWCWDHIEEATYSDEFAQELEGALKQGHVLRHLRPLLLPKDGEMKFWNIPFVYAARKYLKKAPTAAAVATAEVYNHMEAYCEAYLRGMLETPHKHGSAVTKQFLEDRRQKGVALTTDELRKVQDWEEMCDRVREEIDHDSEARELWYDDRLNYRALRGD